MSTKGSPTNEAFAPILKSLEIYDPIVTEAEQLATASRTWKESEADIRVLDEYAESLVLQLRRAPFDPGSDPSDGARQREYEHDVEERGLDDEAVVEAESHLRARKRDEAEQDKGVKQPETPAVASLFFALMLSVSFSPTLKDELFFSIADQLSGWIAAGLTGTLVSTAIVLPVVSVYAARGRDVGNLMGLGAAISFGIANFMIRVSAEEPDYLLAAGLTGWEIAAVTLLEWFAQGYRNVRAEWEEQERNKLRAANLRGAAERQLETSKTRVSEREDRIKNFISHLDARAMLHEHPDDVINAAKFVARQAYRRKLNVNRSVRVGADWRAA